MTQSPDSNNLNTGNFQHLLNETRRKYVATGPNQIWVWGVTSCQSTTRKIKYYCYACEDNYSRFNVGYSVELRDDIDTAVAVIGKILERNNIEPNQLVLHSNHGKVMQSAAMQALLKKRGVAIYQKKPGCRVKPYIGSLFVSLNCRLAPKSYLYPSFEAYADAVHTVVDVYNRFLPIASIGSVVPEQRHRGLDLKTVTDLMTGEVKKIDPVGSQVLCEEDFFRDDLA